MSSELQASPRICLTVLESINGRQGWGTCFEPRGPAQKGDDIGFAPDEELSESEEGTIDQEESDPLFFFEFSIFFVKSAGWVPEPNGSCFACLDKLVSVPARATLR